MNDDRFANIRAILRHGGLCLGLGILLIAGLLAPVPAGAAFPDDDGSIELTSLSLDELLEVEVTSVSRRPESILRSAAAVFVISAEDIRRSGVQTIPDALRLAPGVEVAQIDANKWAVSVRGFNDRFSNKLQVLVDGRTVYSGLYAGVFWDTQVPLLADIERIEVIRGPGATLWGSNAVNGIINMVSRSSADSERGYVEGGGEPGALGFVGARVADAGGGKLTWRLSGVSRDHRATRAIEALPESDYWQIRRLEGRVDVNLDGRNTLLFEAAMHDGDYGQVLRYPVAGQVGLSMVEDVGTMRGGFVMGRWESDLGASGRTRLQTYFDYTERSEFIIGEVRRVFDLDFQHELPLGGRHKVVWGGGYRLTSDNQSVSDLVAFDDPSETRKLASAFIQDEVELVSNRLFLTLGSKFERHGSSAVNAQPSGRALLAVDSRTSLWGAVSRGLRTPARYEERTLVNLASGQDPVSGLPYLLTIIGSRGGDFEKVVAYEAGLRRQVSHNASVDLALFHHDLSDLVGISIGEPEVVVKPAAAPYIFLPTYFDHHLSATARGVELSTEWRPTSRWRLHAHGSVQSIKYTDVDVNPIITVDTYLNSPEQQYQIRSLFDLSENVELDALLHYVGRIEPQDVPSFVRLDLRVGWRPVAGVDLSLIGQNLLEDSHLEFSDPVIGRVSGEVKRQVLARVALRF